MESTKLKLYLGADYVSAFAMSAFVALKEKQLSFELVTLDLKARENYLENYRDLSLTCKIPVLVHEGFALSESSAIAEYLEELVPDSKRIYPQDIKQRARARQLQAWLRSDLLVVRRERPFDLVYFGKKDAPLSDEGRAAVDRLFFVANRLLEEGAEHLFGTSPTYGDLNWEGLSFTEVEFELITSIDKDAWREEIKLHAELFDKLAHRLPQELVATKDKFKKHLGE